MRVKSIQRIIDKEYSGLYKSIKKLILKSEKNYNNKLGEKQSTYLWEHSENVASIVYYLCQKENVKPFIPVLAALLHDAGKFYKGDYHKGNTSEEEYAVRIAESLFKKEGVKEGISKKVKDILLSLYVENIDLNLDTKLVQDADRLDKLGSLGIVNYFTKNALRKRSVKESLSFSLSKELTYAASITLSMKTKTGRKLAQKKSGQTIKFFKTLIRDMSIYSILDLEIRKFTVIYNNIENKIKVIKSEKKKKSIIKKNTSNRSNKIIHLYLVVSKFCLNYKEKPHIQLNLEQGIKCRKLNVELICSGKKVLYSFSFCLPLV